jgi:small subunit ribosomal protein S1
LASRSFRRARRAPPGTASSQPEIAPGARIRGKVERHEKYGVFVLLAPGRTGLIPLSETGVANEANIAREFPVGGDVDVIVLEVDASGRRIRLSAKAVQEAREADEVREYAERGDSAPTEGFGSLADKFRDALKPRQK